MSKWRIEATSRSDKVLIPARDPTHMHLEHFGVCAEQITHPSCGQRSFIHIPWEAADPATSALGQVRRASASTSDHRAPGSPFSPCRNSSIRVRRVKGF